MRETSKTKRLSGDSFPRLYLVGRGIDIGCGGDVVSENAEPFDKIHGDANHILRYRAEGTYDFVYSSHALEHMNDPRKSIREWFGLLKPGGHMVIIVPDSELYEQGVFPPMFNPEHKYRFTLDNDLKGVNLVSIDELIRNLEGCTLISKELQDYNYDYSLKAGGGGRRGIFTGKVFFMAILALNKLGIKVINSRPLKSMARLLHRTLGTRIDQTLVFDATAQIQFIVEKNAG